MQATFSANPRPRAELPAAEALHVALITLGRRLRSTWRGDPAAVGLLHHLACAGPVRISGLADALVLDVSTVSRHVSGLEADGLLVRQEDPDDRRATIIAISEEGRAYVTRALDERSAFLRRALATWPAEDVDALIGYLDRLADDLGRAAGGAA